MRAPAVLIFFAAFTAMTVFVSPLVVENMGSAYAQNKVQINNVKVRSNTEGVTKPDAATIAGMLRRAQDVSLDEKGRELLSERVSIVEEIGRYGITEGTDLLIRLMQEDPNIHVRVASALALGRLGDLKAVPALLQACGSDRAQIRLASAGSLIRFGMGSDETVFSTLKEIAMGSGKETWKTDVQSLNSNPDAEVITTPVSDKMRLALAMADSIAHEKRVQILRIEAMSYLGFVHSPQAKPVLETLTADPDSLVRVNAEKILKSPKFTRIKK